MKFEQWPLWLQLLIAIPNAIVMAFLLWIWWPGSSTAFKPFRVVTLAYLILIYLFYCFFGR
jgi:hypothetical protein